MKATSPSPIEVMTTPPLSTPTETSSSVHLQLHLQNTKSNDDEIHVPTNSSDSHFISILEYYDTTKNETIIATVADIGQKFLEAYGLHIHKVNFTTEGTSGVILKTVINFYCLFHNDVSYYDDVLL